MATLSALKSLVLAVGTDIKAAGSAVASGTASTRDRISTAYHVAKAEREAVETFRALLRATREEVLAPEPVVAKPKRQRKPATA